MGNNATLAKFHEENSRAFSLVSKLQDFVEQGLELGIEIDPSVCHKLEHVAKMVQQGSKLKLALVGGFSEGKTSIAAAWMERLDKKTMIISQQESSNAVNIYTVDDAIELIDTPGLFGFKEKYNAEMGAVEFYRDITKKYVSEAHLLLYVMDSANPIKESHKEDLLWLFRDLNLLPRTIFVLSRFDEISDIEDEWDYRENLRIKQGNVISRLKNMINLAPQEEKELLIVGVAANPFGMGTDYWLANMEQFKRISRISTLQQATSKAIAKNGGYFPIVYAMQKSIIQDILSKQLPAAKAQGDQINDAILALDSNCLSMQQNVRRIAGSINSVQSNLVQYLNNYFSDLIRQLRGCGMETIQEFLDSEIGSDGSIMNSRLQNEFNRQTSTVNAGIEQATLEFRANMTQFNSTVGVLGEEGIKYLQNSGIINAENILRVRDGVVSLGKMLGSDLGSFLKFKPWGATNLAKGLNGVLAAAGVALQIFSEYQRVEAERKFQVAVDNMVKDLDTMRKEFLKLVQSNDFTRQFFPEYIKLTEALQAEQQNIATYKKSSPLLVLGALLE